MRGLCLRRGQSQYFADGEGPVAGRGLLVLDRTKIRPSIPDLRLLFLEF